MDYSGGLEGRRLKTSWRHSKSSLEPSQQLSYEIKDIMCSRKDRVANNSQKALATYNPNKDVL
jgi:hypothetical protein